MKSLIFLVIFSLSFKSFSFIIESFSFFKTKKEKSLEEKLKFKDESGNTSLHKASFNRDFKEVKLLIKNGADISLKNNHGRIAFDHIASSGNTEIAQLFFDHGFKIKDAKNAFLTASTKSHIDFIKLLLEEGMDVNTQNTYGKTALMIAAANKDLKLMKLLFKYQANPHLKDKYGNTAIHYANSLEVLNDLISKKADLFMKNKAKESILHRASFIANSEMISFLIKKGLDIHAKNSYGRSPFFLAATGREGFKGDQRIKSMELLLKKGALLEAKDYLGETALDEAYSFKVIEFLISKGAKIRTEVIENTRRILNPRVRQYLKKH